MVPGGSFMGNGSRSVLWFFKVPGWFFMVPGCFFHDYRWNFMVIYGSKLVFMVIHGSMSVCHDSRLVFKVFHCSRLV